MALFNFRKPKDKTHAPACRQIKSITVLGAGCKTCHRQYENVKEAVHTLGLSVPVEYITNMEIIMEYGVMVMPAIVIDGNVAASGKLLSTREVEKLLRG